MRTDVDKIAFAAIVGGGTIAEIDASDLFQIALGVDITGVTGAPTSARVVAIPLHGTDAVGSGTEHIRKTSDFTANGKYLLGKRDTAIAEPAIENVYGKIRVIADFTGGTAPTMTGSLYAFKKRF